MRNSVQLLPSLKNPETLSLSYTRRETIIGFCWQVRSFLISSVNNTMSAVIDVFVWLFWLMFIAKKHSFHITYRSYKGKVNPVNFNHHVRVSLWELRRGLCCRLKQHGLASAFMVWLCQFFFQHRQATVISSGKKRLTRQWYLNFQLGLNSTGQPDRRVADMTSSDQHSVLMWTVQAGVHRNGLPRRQYKCGKALSGSQ